MLIIFTMSGTLALVIHLSAVLSLLWLILLFSFCPHQELSDVFMLACLFTFITSELTHHLSHCSHRIAVITWPSSHCRHYISVISLPSASQNNHHNAVITLPLSYRNHHIAVTTSLITSPSSHRSHHAAVNTLQSSQGVAVTIVRFINNIILINHA